MLRPKLLTIVPTAGETIQMAYTTHGNGNFSVDVSGLDIESGDQMLLFYGSDTEGGSPTISGFTSVLTATASGNMRGTVYTRTATGGESTFLLVSSGNGQIAIIVVIKGYTYNSIGSAEGTSGEPNPPSRTVNIGDLVFVWGVLDDDTVTYTPDTGWTSLLAGTVNELSLIISYMLAYQIATSTTADHPEFDGGVSDAWVAFTVENTVA